jgi:hypothetical protein
LLVEPFREEKFPWILWQPENNWLLVFVLASKPRMAVSGGGRCCDIRGEKRAGAEMNGAQVF